MAANKHFKTELDLKHEQDNQRQKAETARRRYLKTPEGQAFKQACEEQSAIWRGQWEKLEADRNTIRMTIPHAPRLIVTGGRNFCEMTDVGGKEIKALSEALDERRALAWVLDAIKPSCVIHGGARGADRWAGIWADKRGVECIVIEADWTRYGHQAGPERNQRMIDTCSPTAGVAFPGGAGTADCMSRMNAAGLPVFVARVV